MRRATSLLLLLLSTVAGGCRAVQPWQREVLSLRSMSGDGERAEDKFRQHWQESREGGSGGYCHPGGGCGCN